MNDLAIYDDRTHYVGRVGERWYRWPSVRDGWLQRRPASERDAAPSRQLEPKLAELALGAARRAAAARTPGPGHRPASRLHRAAEPERQLGLMVEVAAVTDLSRLTGVDER